MFTLQGVFRMGRICGEEVPLADIPYTGSREYRALLKCTVDQNTACGLALSRSAEKQIK